MYGSQHGLRQAPVFFPRPTYGASAMMSRHSTGGTFDEIKSFLDKESLGIDGLKNKHVLLAAAVAGVAYYGYTQRWF